MKGDHDDGDNRDNYGDGEGEGDCVVDAYACGAASTRRCGDAPASEPLARSRFHETAPLSTQGEVWQGLCLTLNP